MRLKKRPIRLRCLQTQPLRPAGGRGAMTPPRVTLDIDATREKLAALGLDYAVDALEGLLAEAVCAETPAHVFPDGFLEAERSGREERRIKTMPKTVKIPTGQTLENFDFAFQPTVERSRIETLATGARIRNAEVIPMQGPPGVGKRGNVGQECPSMPRSDVQKRCV
jgi:hypothetical protein